MKTLWRLMRMQLRPYVGRLAVRIAIAAFIAATPYAFSFLGKWLVDEVLQVTGPPKSPPVAASAGAGKGTEPATGGAEVGGPPAALPAHEATAPAKAAEGAMPRLEWKAKTPAEKLRLLGIFLAVSLALHVLTSGVGAYSELLNSRTVQSLAYDMRSRVHDKLAAADMAFFSREQIGQLMTRVMDDAGAIPGNLTNLVINTCTQFMMLGLGAFLLVRLNPRMALIALAALPFYAVSCVVFLPRLRRNTEEIRVGGAEMNGYLVERLSGVATVKNYAQEEQEIERFGVHVDRQLGLARRQNRLNLLFGTCTTLITSFATLSVLALGFIYLRNQTMQLGEVMAFYQVTAQLFVPISALVGMTTVAQTLEVLGNRVFGVLDAPEVIAEAAEPVQLEDIRGDVSFRDVSLRYQEGGAFAVQDVTFDIPAGSTACIVGPTGCGKSTLIALLTRLYDPVSGTVEVDGVDIRRLPLRALRRAVGNVLYECQVFSGTIAENIAYGNTDATAADVEAAARAVGLDGFVAAQAKGYETLLGRGGIALSREELVKLNVARALITQPAILTVDDTYASLDESVEERLREAVRHTLRDETVIIATSRLSICEDADLVIVMEKGRVVQTGTHAALLEKPGLYRRMVMRQLGLTEEMTR